jgi:hypothetical protein
MSIVPFVVEYSSRDLSAAPCLDGHAPAVRQLRSPGKPQEVLHDYAGVFVVVVNELGSIIDLQVAAYGDRPVVHQYARSHDVFFGFLIVVAVIPDLDTPVLRTIAGRIGFYDRSCLRW